MAGDNGYDSRSCFPPVLSESPLAGRFRWSLCLCESSAESSCRCPCKRPQKFRVRRLRFVSDEDRDVLSTLWQEARIHCQVFRARFFLGGKDSAKQRVVDVVGAGHVAPDGAEMWLFTAIPFPSSGSALPPIETNLQITLNALPIQAWYAHASGALAFVNQTTATYLGLPSNHPLGLAGGFEAAWDVDMAFLHPDDRAHSNRNWKEAIESGKAREDQLRILGAQGEYRWFLSRAEPLRNSDGQIQYWVGVNIDIDDGRGRNRRLAP